MYIILQMSYFLLSSADCREDLILILYIAKNNN